MDRGAVRSKFQAGGEDSSAESSGAHSDSDNDGAGGGGARRAAGPAKVVSRFAADSSDSEESTSGRVVRSEKDKKFDALLTIITAIRNQLRNNNWVEIQDGAWGVGLRAQAAGERRGLAQGGARCLRSA